MPAPERQLDGDSLVRLTPEPGEAKPLHNGVSKPEDSALRDGHDQGDSTSLGMDSLSGLAGALRMADGGADSAAAAAAAQARQGSGAAHAGPPTGLEPPTNPMVTVLLTDLYQITMAYAYWKADKHKDHAV